MARCTCSSPERGADLSPDAAESEKRARSAYLANIKPFITIDYLICISRREESEVRRSADGVRRHVWHEVPLTSDRVYAALLVDGVELRDEIHPHLIQDEQPMTKRIEVIFLAASLGC